ncbi:pH-dependent sodium/proton antiporter [Legionella gratiana]|uniref:Na(+)/H(+) antiporter NhaA n=1 Tax=Legionella gratiana TaxID=45066 RepID=A0A378J9H0_9GAMM|nr:Na+/H+ antiporter NhaA [Legionella gratiana]KTD10616.1 pH-dependent sodium/proton antiporter [Legionella gratiana]STX43537.1 sodium-proton antiporter [Legionella gratiana]
MAISWIRKFIKLEAVDGILLLAVAALGIFFENSPWRSIFVFAYSTPLFAVENIHFPNSLQSIINNGLMTIFFLSITLEIKRELLKGELSTYRRAILPVIAAIGGMVVPAFIYIVINFNNPQYFPGWAIPTATDIAFSLAVLTLLGSRIPSSLKIFLLALALIDDLGAIIIIAFFYTHHLNLWWLFYSLGCIGFLFVLNYFRVSNFFPYAIIGILLWVCFIYSGIHGTLAGVFVGFAVPLTSSFTRLEEQLDDWVAYGVLPLFVFVNAGFPLSIFTLNNLSLSVSIGVILGLFIGKPIGIFVASWISTKLGVAHLPKHVTWIQMLGVAFLCGMGFTVSLFIETLAFPAQQQQLHLIINAAIVLASLLSGLSGYLILRYLTPKHPR